MYSRPATVPALLRRVAAEGLELPNLPRAVEKMRCSGCLDARAIGKLYDLVTRLEAPVSDRILGKLADQESLSSLLRGAK